MRIRTTTTCDNDAIAKTVIASFIEEPGGYSGSKEIPIGPADDWREIHEYAARKLSNRLALRVVQELSDGYIFLA